MTKLATLTRRSTVQNFLPQLVFPGLINNLVNFGLVQLTVIASSETEKKYINLDTHTHTQTNKQNRKRQRERHTHTQTNRKTHTQTRQIDTHTRRKTHARRGAHAHTGMDTNTHTKNIPFKNFISLRRLL